MSKTLSLSEDEIKTLLVSLDHLRVATLNTLLVEDNEVKRDRYNLGLVIVELLINKMKE